MSGWKSNKNNPNDPGCVEPRSSFQTSAITSPSPASSSELAPKQKKKKNYYKDVIQHTHINHYSLNRILVKFKRPLTCKSVTFVLQVQTL